ncbi:MAG TPA: hypothetical protein VFP45_03390 [Candidatus Nitrosotalea sp.]|nr:hypothetical protein [Candidatus Nitrosotalea sp.]
MEKVIDRAVKEARERPSNEDAKEPKQKKRKKDSSSKKKKNRDDDIQDDDIEEAMAILQEPVKASPEHAIAKKELKNLHLRFPDIDVSQIAELRNKIDQMTHEEIKTTIDDIKSTINQKTNTSEHALGAFALLLSKITGEPKLYDKIMKDDEILAAAEYLCPNLEEYLSAPLQLAHKIAHHVSDLKFPKDNVPQ